MNFYISIFKPLMYRKFVYLVLLIMIVSLFVFTYVVFNHKNLFLSEDYPLRMFVLNIANNKLNKEMPDTIMIGDSRAQAGYIPNQLMKKNYTINLAMSGSTPIEGFLILNRYLKHHKLKKLIMSYGPFHLAKQDTYWEYTVKHKLFSYKEYYNIEHNSKLLKDISTLDNNKTFTDYYSPFKYSTNFINGLIEFRWLDYDNIIHTINENNGHFYHGQKNGSSGLTEEAKTDNFHYSKLINLYINKIINLAKNHNVKIYYYTMPFNETSYKNITDSYEKNYNNYIDSLNITNCNKIFYMNNNQFGDESHLFKGSVETTKEIYQCINN